MRERVVCHPILCDSGLTLQAHAAVERHTEPVDTLLRSYPAVEPGLDLPLTGVSRLGDAYHFARAGVVGRPWSAFCAVTDLASAPACWSSRRPR